MFAVVSGTDCLRREKGDECSHEVTNGLAVQDLLGILFFVVWLLVVVLAVVVFRANSGAWADQSVQDITKVVLRAAFAQQGNKVTNKQVIKTIACTTTSPKRPSCGQAAT